MINVAYLVIFGAVMLMVFMAWQNTAVWQNQSMGHYTSKVP